MTTLVNGEVRGLRWFELPREIYGDTKGLKGDQAAPVVTVVVIPACYPNDKRIAEFFNPKYGKTFLASIGFRPIVEERDLPGRLVGYGSPDGRHVRQWLADTFEVPDGIEIAYDYPDYGWDRKLVVVATTEKDGRIVKVRRKVDPAAPLDEALPKVFAWLLKNAPRPTTASDGPSCGTHVAAILRHATAGAVQMIREWLQKPSADRPNRTIDGALLPGACIDSITLKTTRTSNAVLAEIRLPGGHEIVDEPGGISIKLMASMPETLVNALPGETLGSVVDLDWTKEISIRSASMAASDAVKMRGYAPGAPFEVPEPRPIGKDEAVAMIRRLATDGTIRTIDSALYEKLAAMTPQDAATTLLAIRHHEYYDLAAHGLPGWWSSNSTGYVTLNRSPMRDGSDLATMF